MQTAAPSSRQTWKHFAGVVTLCGLGFALVTAVSLSLYRMAGTPARLVVAIVAAAGMVAVYAAAERLIEARAAAEVGIRQVPHVVLGAVLGAGLVAMSVGIVAALGAYRVIGTSPIDGLLARVGPSLHSAVWEELAFRGLLFRWLATWLGGVRAMALSAAFFGAIHGLLDNGSAWSALAVAIEAGVLLSMAFWVSGTLWFPVGMHFGWNLCLGGVFGSPVSGRSVPSVLVAEWIGPPWATGGAFGLEASLPAIVVCLAATAALHLSRRAWGEHLDRP